MRGKCSGKLREEGIDAGSMTNLMEQTRNTALHEWLSLPGETYQSMDMARCQTSQQTQPCLRNLPAFPGERVYTGQVLHAFEMCQEHIGRGLAQHKELGKIFA
jgi:hypothetical protein